MNPYSVSFDRDELWRFTVAKVLAENLLRTDPRKVPFHAIPSREEANAALAYFTTRLHKHLEVSLDRLRLLIRPSLS